MIALLSSTLPARHVHTQDIAQSGITAAVVWMPAGTWCQLRLSSSDASACVMLWTNTH